MSAPCAFMLAGSGSVGPMSEHPSRLTAAHAPPAPTLDATAKAPRAGARRRAALSPSQAKDFKQCPLLFRLRSVDRLPEPGSLATHKGTLVHAVLERLYDLPARDRTAAAALDMLPGLWDQHRDSHPDVMTLFSDDARVGSWLEEVRALVSAYFRLENSTRLEPAERELLVQAETGTGLLLRGFVDRLDMAPDGAMRVVDYKTGRSPGPRFQHEALFQMRFYGLVLWRMRGRAPRRLQLVYLKDGRTLTHDPQLRELESTEASLEHLWDEIDDCAAREDFAPRRSRLCDWCSFQAVCPLFGGAAPPIPQEGLTRLLTARAHHGLMSASRSPRSR